MTALLSALGLLLAAQAQETAPQDVPVPTPPEAAPAGPAGFRAGLRAGAWQLPDDFRNTGPNGDRELLADTLLCLGLDAGYEPDWLSVTLSADYATTGDLRLLSAGLLLGVETDLFPLAESAVVNGRLSAGPLFARLEVKEDGFGDFDGAFGLDVRADLRLRTGSDVEFGLWAALRAVSFDYEPHVTTGDDSYGGTTFAGGLSVSLRF